MKTEPQPEDIAQPDRLAQMMTTLLNSDLPPEWREGLKLLQRGFAGEPGATDTALLALSRLKEAGPTGLAAPTLADQCADPVELARKALLKAVHGDQKLFQNMGRDILEAKERELAGPKPTPIERMLAQQAALCEMQLCHFEQKYARRLNAQPDSTLGIAQAEFYHRQVARAQARFQSALKCLAQVRRLQLPTVQVNVANRQINVGSGQVQAGQAQVNVLAEPAEEE